MPIPVDPFDLAPHTAPRAADLNTRFGILYSALDKTEVGLGADNFEDESFALSKFPAAIGWQQVSVPGMKPSGLAAPQLRFFKDQVGIVHVDPSWLYGTGLTIPPGTLLTTFPAGYRPGYAQSISFWQVANSTPATAVVGTNGQMIFPGGGSGPGGGQGAVPDPARYAFNGWWLAEN